MSLPGHLSNGAINQAEHNSAREARIAANAGKDHTKAMHKLTKQHDSIDKLHKSVRKKIKVIHRINENDSVADKDGKGYTVKHWGKHHATVYHDGKQIGEVTAHPAHIGTKKNSFIISHKNIGRLGNNSNKTAAIHKLAKYHKDNHRV